ncbi:MAG: DUF1573 domain-containing protein [Planctomycetaceae bacterium]
MAEGQGQSIAEPGAAAALAETPQPATGRKRPWRSIAETLGWVAVFAALIAGWARWQTGSFSLVWPYLQGERLLFDPQHVVIDNAPAGTIVERSVRVLNRSSTDVTLLGSQPSCGCITLDEFPIKISPGPEHLLKLKIGIPSQPGPFEHTVKVFSNEEEARQFVITLSGTSQ